MNLYIYLPCLYHPQDVTLAWHITSTYQVHLNFQINGPLGINLGYLLKCISVAPLALWQKPQGHRILEGNVKFQDFLASVCAMSKVENGQTEKVKAHSK